MITCNLLILGCFGFFFMSLWGWQIKFYEMSLQHLDGLQWNVTWHSCLVLFKYPTLTFHIVLSSGPLYCDLLHLYELFTLYFPVPFTGMLSGLQVVPARQPSQVSQMHTPKLSHQNSPATGTKCTTTFQSWARPSMAQPVHLLTSYRHRWGARNCTNSGIS